jgi:hypothetical protein
MDDNAVVYQRKEKVTVIAYDGRDYLVEDTETGTHYMIDQHYFRRHYESTADRLPIHQEVWDKLDKQARELYQLKQANTKLRDELKGERKKFESYRKGKPKNNHYRNGQKRGSHGRNG